MIIKEYLNERGISQAFLCRKTHIGRAKLSLSLNGDRRLSLEEYAAICGALGVNTDYFLKPCKLEEDRTVN
jgi:transcriptional regulator with XRE-family HTH domain